MLIWNKSVFKKKIIFKLFYLRTIYPVMKILHNLFKELYATFKKISLVKEFSFNF